MGYFPVALDLAKLPILVVGGGPLAEEKVRALLAAQPRQLTVIAERVSEEVLRWAREGRLQYQEGAATSADVAAFAVVILAAEDRSVNGKLAVAASRAGALVNVVDDAEASAFLAMAQVRRGPLLLAVSTSGIAPGLARWVRRRWEEEFSPKWEELTVQAGRLRREWPVGERRERLERWLAERLGEEAPR